MARNRKNRGGHRRAAGRKAQRREAKIQRSSARDSTPKQRSRRRIGLRASGGYLLAFSTAVVTSILALPMLVGITVPTAAAVGLAVGLILIVTVDRTTLVERWSRRRRMHTALTPTSTASSDGAAVALAGASGGGDPTAPTGVWGTGSNEAVVWMEVTPATPFHISTVSTSGAQLGQTAAPDTDHPVIDMKELAPLMTKGDLVLQRLEAVTMGMRTALPTAAARTAAAVAGSVPTHQAGRTFLKVTLRLDDAYAAIRARATGGDYAIGTHRAVLKAAERVLVRSEGMGLKVSVLSPAQTDALSRDVLNWVGEGAEVVHWDHLGGEGAGGVVSVVPGTGPEDQAKWTSVAADRIFEVSRLQRNSHTGVIEQAFYMTYAQRETEAPSLPKALGLNALKGQQVQAVSQIIPAAAPERLDLPADPLGAPAPLAYSGGLGVYLGTGKRGKAFMQMSPGTGSVLHIAGPVELAQQFLLRLSAQPLVVDVRIEDLLWRDFVVGLDSPLITFNDQTTADIVVVSPGGEHALEDHQTAIVVSAASPTTTPAASIVRSGSELVVTSGRQQVTVDWVITASEDDFLVHVPAAKQ